VAQPSTPLAFTPAASGVFSSDVTFDQYDRRIEHFALIANFGDRYRIGSLGRIIANIAGNGAIAYRTTAPSITGAGLRADAACALSRSDRCEQPH